MAAKFQTATYSGTGAQTLIKTDSYDQGANVTVSAGASDVYQVEVQMTGTAQRVAVPGLKSLSDDVTFYVPSEVHGIGLNITTNSSGNIIIDVNKA